MLALMSDQVWLGLFTLVSTISLAWMQMRTKKAVANVHSEAKKASADGNDRTHKINAIGAATNDLRKLANGEKLGHLEALQRLSHENARLDPTPENKAEASFYVRILNEHRKAQLEYTNGLGSKKLECFDDKCQDRKGRT